MASSEVVRSPSWRGPSVALLLLLLAVLMQGTTAHAQGAQTSAFHFADATALSIGESQLEAQDGVRVRLVNDTTRRQVLTVQLSGFSFRPRTGPVGVELNVDKAKLVLGAAGSGSVALSLPATTVLAKGTYSGELVAFARGGPVLRRSIVIQTASPAKPAVKALAVRGEWWLPDVLALRQRDLPLDSVAGTDQSKLDLAAGQVLGYLSGSDGGTARVTWNGKSKRVYGQTALALELDIEGFSRPGTYTGTIDLLPGDPSAGEVTLTARYTHAVVWPILLLGLGILAALLFQVVTQVYRVVWQLQRQLAELGVTFRGAQTRFAALTEGKAYGTYAIDMAVRTEIGRLREEANQLKGPLTPTLDKEKHTAVVTALGELAHDIAAWAPASTFDGPAGFVGDLTSLDSRVQDIHELLV